MRFCDRHDVLSLGYFMIGFLWDTDETVSETAAFIRAVRPDLLTIHFAHPYPGTPYYEEVAAQRRRSFRWAQAEPAMESGTHAARSDRARLYADAPLCGPAGPRFDPAQVPRPAPPRPAGRSPRRASPPGSAAAAG
jgi:hypothetical protein